MGRRPRRRNHKVVIEYPVGTPDGGGGKSENWLPHTTIYADIVRKAPLRADLEHVEAGGITVTPVVSIHVAATTKTRTITGEMRARRSGTTEVYDINEVYDPDGLGRDLVIVARKGMPN